MEEYLKEEPVASSRWTRGDLIFTPTVKIMTLRRRVNFFRKRCSPGNSRNELFRGPRANCNEHERVKFCMTLARQGNPRK